MRGAISEIDFTFFLSFEGVWLVCRRLQREERWSQAWRGAKARRREGKREFPKKGIRTSFEMSCGSRRLEYGFDPLNNAPKAAAAAFFFYDSSPLSFMASLP